MSDIESEGKGKNVLMVDQDAMIRLINTTMMPALTELKFIINGMSKDLTHYIDMENSRYNNAMQKVADIDTRLTVLETILGGTGEDTGLKGKLSQIQEWMKSRIWFERLIIGALVVQILGLILLYLQTSITHVIVGN